MYITDIKQFLFTNYSPLNITIIFTPILSPAAHVDGSRQPHDASDDDGGSGSSSSSGGGSGDEAVRSRRLGHDVLLRVGTTGDDRPTHRSDDLLVPVHGRTAQLLAGGRWTPRGSLRLGGGSSGCGGGSSVRCTGHRTPRRHRPLRLLLPHGKSPAVYVLCLVIHFKQEEVLMGGFMCPERGHFHRETTLTERSNVWSGEC